jgi:hypothetical protein
MNERPNEKKKIEEVFRQKKHQAFCIFHHKIVELIKQK